MPKFVKRAGFLNKLKRVYAALVWPLVAIRANRGYLTVRQVDLWLENHGYTKATEQEIDWAQSLVYEERKE